MSAQTDKPVYRQDGTSIKYCPKCDAETTYNFDESCMAREMKCPCCGWFETIGFGVL